MNANISIDDQDVVICVIRKGHNPHKIVHIVNVEQKLIDCINECDESYNILNNSTFDYSENEISPLATNHLFIKDAIDIIRKKPIRVVVR